MAVPMKIVIACVNPGKIGSRRLAVQVSKEDKFIDVFLKAASLSKQDLIPESITEIKIYEQYKHACDGIFVQKDMNVFDVVDDLNCRYIDFICCEPDKNNNKELNAFSVLMKNRIRHVLPEKPKPTSPNGKLTGPQTLLTDLIDFADELGCGWTVDLIGSGQKVLKKLADALWYIDHAHSRLKEQGCPVPAVFKKFQHYNHFSKHHHTPPQVKTERLVEICGDLADVSGMPSMSSEKNKNLNSYIEDLNATLVRYNERLLKNKKLQEKSRSLDPADKDSASESNETSCQYISSGNVEDPYTNLDEYMCKQGQYEYVDLDDFSPSNRYKRRDFIKKLRISKPVLLYRVAYGGSVGTLNFLWTVSDTDSQERLIKNSHVTKKITESLPKYSSRQMRRDFINKYFDYVKCPKSVLRSMFFDLSGFEPTAETSDQKAKDDIAAEILLGSDDPKLILDMRSMNGSQAKYDDFYDEVAKYFDEQIMHVHERRKDGELYLPLCISIEDLREEIKKRLPDDASVPSAESLRLQFTPTNQFSKTALKYSSRLNVKFRVQTRLARVHHQDAHYVAAYYKYLKHFCVMFSECTQLVCLDDKAIVPVGEPGVPISTGVRGHNKVLTPNEGPRLVATDHDFHIGGIVPSVVLVCEIPENASDSFFQGNVFVTTKDKVFEPSTPFRHSTELAKILLERRYSENSLELDRTILCIVTDGGPDHRLTYDSVKAALLELFLTLNVDCLIALRTAPNHSWMNPAERCMSILNLALQHVSLCRDEMPEKFEKMIKGKASLAAVRNQAELHPELKNAFQSSIEPTIDTVNKRFERMKLKGEKLQVYRGATQEEIDRNLDLVKIAAGSTATSFTSSSKSKAFKQDAPLQRFLETHTKSSHYCFQLMKCSNSNCEYCTHNPVRNKDVFEKLSFLPEPSPDLSGAHYLPFVEVYGKPVTVDKFRPSARNSDFDDEAVEEDKKNRDVLKAPKARDVIKCAECHKPRLVYCQLKTDREQDAVLRCLKEDKLYVCGDAIAEDNGLVTLRAINCTSDVEIAYYSASFSKIAPPVCCYCGTEDELLDDNNIYIQELYAKFSRVRPLCKLCRGNGREAKTWGQKFIKKRRQ